MRIIRSTIGDSHAKLEQCGFIDQTFLDQLVCKDKMSCVKNFQFRSDSQIPDPGCHIPQHRGGVCHDVIAFGKVHCSTVEAADFRTDQFHMAQPFFGTGHVGLFLHKRKRLLRRPQHQVSPHSCGEVDDDIHPGIADTVHDLSVKFGISGRRTALRIPDMNMNDRCTCLGGSNAAIRNLFGGDRNLIALAGCVACPGQGAGDENFMVHMRSKWVGYCFGSVAVVSFSCGFSMVSSISQSRKSPTSGLSRASRG